jgi:Tol biopolymer transport system component/DNA-binding winged helix-turn-helix (wHTH) protein
MELLSLLNCSSGLESGTWGGLMDAPTSSSRRVRTGLFEIDLGSAEIYKEGRRVPLQEQPFRVLAMLLERPGEVISREELQARLWPTDTFVGFDEGINTAIRKLRVIFGDSADNPRFIETIPRRGYRFIAPVQEAATKSAQSSKHILEHSRELTSEVHIGAQQPQPETNSTLVKVSTEQVPPQAELKPTILPELAIDFPERDVETARLAVEAPAQVRHVRRNRGARLLFGLACGVVVSLFAVWLRPVARPPRVTGIRQITHMGTVVYNQNLLMIGARIYFMSSEKGGNQVRYVSLDDDVVSSVEKPFPATEIFDALPSANELLIAEMVPGFPPTNWRRNLWRWPLLTGIPRRVGDVFADDAAWSPDGRTILYTHEPDRSLNLVESDGSNVRRLATLPGAPFKPRWSPDGNQIRASVLAAKGSGISLWRLDRSGRNLTRMVSDWSPTSSAWAGRWTRDGSYFFFTGFQGGKKNIWALREKRDFLRRDGTQPVQLTDGSLDFYLPTPSDDGKTLYAVGTQLRGQLTRYNASSRQFEPYADGLSADYVTFSRDGKWMAYVTYPEGALVRSRMDGSERLQLTFAPMRALDPRWSPDGSLIAFVGAANAGAAQEVYVVSANGGSSRLAAPGSSDGQFLADWSPDRQDVLFVSSNESGSERALRAVNMKTGTQTILSSTPDMGMGRVSPDGRYLAGLSVPGQNLLLYDMVSGRTRQIAEFADYPNWSPDGKFIYYSTLSLSFVLPPEKAGIFRVKIADGTVERLAGVPTFPLAGNWGRWFGLAPDGSVLVLRQLGSFDIYSLDVDLP